MEYCIVCGSEALVSYAKESIYTIRTLKEFQYIDDRGRDQGIQGIHPTRPIIVQCDRRASKSLPYCQTRRGWSRRDVQRHFLTIYVLPPLSLLSTTIRTVAANYSPTEKLAQQSGPTPTARSTKGCRQMCRQTMTKMPPFNVQLRKAAGQLPPQPRLVARLLVHKLGQLLRASIC